MFLKQIVFFATAVLSGGAFLWGVAPVSRQGSAELLYSIPDRGALSLTTEGSQTPTAAVSYARIQPSSGLTPSGLGLFAFRNAAGELITETAVPTTPLITSGRVFVTYTTDILDTGIAIANPNDADVQIDFFFSDQRREQPDYGAGSFTLGAHQQLARLISEEPFNAETSTRGALTLTSTLPVAVVALRESIFNGGDIVFGAMPVADLTQTSTDTVFLPHFVFGGPWDSRVILVNPTDEMISGRMGFVSRGSVSPAVPGQTTAIGLSGPIATVHAYTLEPRGFAEFLTTGISPIVTTTGSFRIVPDEGSVAPIAQSVLTNFGNDVLPVSEAVVPPSDTGTAFRMYVEHSGDPLTPGSIQSGVAIASVPFEPTLEQTTVTLELYGLDGSLVAVSEIIVPPSGQRSFFADEVFEAEEVPSPFQGVLRVTADDRISMMGLRLRTNERGEFLMSTTPPTNEAGVGTTTELLFPHLVDGGGWTTQAVLFTGVAGQRAEGALRFFDVGGNAADLILH